MVFVTGNPYKFEVAKKALSSVSIEVIQEKLETPEIQSAEVSEIAAYSAKWAANKLNKPVVVSDTGYYIESLNGFPGPFVKYINKWLSAEEMLKLMEGKTNRKVEIKICLAFCKPGENPVIFSSITPGTISLQVGAEREGEKMMDRLFIPEGYNKPQSELPKEEMVSFWANKEDYWKKLAKLLTS